MLYCSCSWARKNLYKNFLQPIWSQPPEYEVAPKPVTICNTWLWKYWWRAAGL